MTDAPIEPQDFYGGVKVVDIGDIRVARGLTRRPVSSCKHLRLVYDDKERRVWCEDCQTEVPAFDAFTALVERWDAGMKKTRRLIDEANEAQRFTLRSRAAKAIDEAWRKHNMVPACPHCRNGLFPEDFTKGVPLVGKDYAKAKIERERTEKAR